VRVRRYEEKQVAGLLRLTMRCLRIALILASTAALAAEPQEAVKALRIGVVGSGPMTREIEDGLFAFRAGLREHGHQATIQYRWRVAGEEDPLLRLSDELVALRSDALLFLGESALRTVPHFTLRGLNAPIVVVLYTANPGDVMWRSLDAGITAVSVATPSMISEQVRLLKEVLPGALRIAILWDPSDFGNARAFSEAFDAAGAAGLRPHGHEVRSTKDLERAFSALTASARADALLVIASSTTVGHMNRVVDLATRAHIPAIYPLHEFADAGGPVSYGTGLRQTLRQAAASVVDLLRGAGAGSPQVTRGGARSGLAIERPARPELVVNLKAAKVLGLTISPSLLQRADRVIE
jgi:putative ABC transport system substrate-binding protein